MQAHMSSGGASETDAELVRRTIRGEVRAFDVLADRYYRAVGGYLLRRVQRPDVAEDLTQETFLEAFRSLRAGRLPEIFAGWLYGIAHNRLGKWLRRKAVLSFSAAPPEEIAAPAEPAVIEEAEAQRHLLGRLEAGLAELPTETRQLLALKHREGKTCEQIAATVGRPVGTVKSLLSRAYRALRERLGGAATAEKGRGS
jgi:RNA polymerase sigma-70 factor, ECF subfamily